MTPDILQTTEVPIAAELFSTLQKAMSDDAYFLIDDFPDEHRHLWPGIQFKAITEEPEVLSEKAFVILKTPTSGLPLSIIQPNPEVYKVKAKNSDLSVHYIVYNPVSKWNIPPLFICRDEAGSPKVLTREVKMLKITELGAATVEFLNSLKSPRLEGALIEKEKIFNWAEFINNVLKNKLVIPINSIPLDSTDETIWEVYMNDILPTVAGLLYAQAFIEE